MSKSKQSRYTLNLYFDNPLEIQLIDMLNSMNKMRRAEMLRTWIKLGAAVEMNNQHQPVYQQPAYAQSQVATAYVAPVHSRVPAAAPAPAPQNIPDRYDDHESDQTSYESSSDHEVLDLDSHTESATTESDNDFDDPLAKMKRALS